MSVLASLGAELNGWVTALGGVAVIIAVSVLMQKWHERRVRRDSEESLRLQRQEIGLLREALVELRIGNGINKRR